MKKLTDKELEIMEILWNKGPISMRDILTDMPEPKPHFNTVATFVHRLEIHGMVKHQELGARFFLYEAAVSKEKYSEARNKEHVSNFFEGSYMKFISHLVQEREISVEELKELIKMVEE